MIIVTTMIFHKAIFGAPVPYATRVLRAAALVIANCVGFLY